VLSVLCISFSENNKAQAQPVIALFEDLGTAPVIDEKLMDNVKTPYHNFSKSWTKIRKKYFEFFQILPNSAKKMKKK
jgi:hypothetical protein